MKKSVIFILAIIIISLVNTSDIKAQNVLDNVYVPGHVPNREPIPYTYLRESDVMWSKRIWRVMDMREKINHPLYFPKKPINTRISMIDVIMEGVRTGDLTAYTIVDIADDDNTFVVPLTKDEIDKIGGAGIDTIYNTNPDTGDEEVKLIEIKFETAQVKQYMMKEVWFFDNQRSVMDVRIVGMCPIRFYTKGGTDEVRMEKLFWIYFPEVRPFFAKKEVYNVHNDAECRTFDDMFWKRVFSSYIIRESNVYDNRRISSYKKGLGALLEAEKIKDDLFQIEHDLWEY